MEWRHTVWPEARLVYTAVPKVANTSVKAALLASFRTDEEYTENAVHKDFVPYLSARPERIDERYPDYLHFTFVRNPYDRLVSFWAQKIKPGTGVTPRLEELGFRPYRGFAETAELACAVPDGEADPHFRSQTFVLVHDGRFMPQFVGRLETASDDWAVLRRLIAARGGWPLQALPVRTTSEHRPAAEYYDDRLAARVADRYERDFALLGYDTRLPVPSDA